MLTNLRLEYRKQPRCCFWSLTTNKLAYGVDKWLEYSVMEYHVEHGILFDGFPETEDRIDAAEFIYNHVMKKKGRDHDSRNLSLQYGTPHSDQTY